MKITWISLKGVCLLLLGLATTGGGRSFAADINTQNFAVLAESSSATTAGTETASPFKDESASTPVKSALAAPVTENYSPSCPAGAACCDNDCFYGVPGRFWFTGQYLDWWTTGAHLPPMVSGLTGVNENIPVTLFGDRDIRDGSHEGYRMDFGMWLDCCHCWGIEADYFDVTGKPDSYDSGFSDGYGFVKGVYSETPMTRIIYDPQVGNLVPDYIAYTGTTVGRITVDTSDYFQSAGIWLRRQLRAAEWSTNGSDVNWTDPHARTFRLDALFGYRFARLIDTVNEQDDSFVYGTGQAAYANEISFVNDYKTVNNFNGTELGLNGVYTMGRWSLDVVGKVAIGFNNEFVSLYNQESIDSSNAVLTAVTPVLANPTPTQEFSRNRFAAIPELTVTGGYQVTDHLKFTVGYDLLYWSAVVRAADQIAVEPTTGYPYGTSTGNYASLPAFTWNESHFLAQGLRLGAEVRF